MRIYRSCCAYFVALACASVAHADNDVWDGNGTPDGGWTSDVNWVDNSVPGIGDTATFNLAQAFTVTFTSEPSAIDALTVSAGNLLFQSANGAHTLVVLKNPPSGPQDLVVSGVGTTLTLGSEGQIITSVDLVVGNNLSIQNGAVLATQSGSDITASGLSNAGLNGQLLIGGNSFLQLTGILQTNFIGLGGGAGSLVLPGGGGGGFIPNANLGIAESGTVGTTGAVLIRGGSFLTLGGNLSMANLNVAGQSATLDIAGFGSNFEQFNHSGMIIGSAANGTAAVNVGVAADHGTLRTGAEQITINATGAVTIGSGANSGEFIAAGNIDVNTAGGTGGSGGVINVNGPTSTFTQSGATTITVGHATTGAAVINVGVTANGGTLSTGSGQFTINPTGVITIGSGATSGTLNARGDVLVNGGVLNRNGGTFALAAGKNFTAQNNGDVNFNGGYAINGGSTYTIRLGADFSTTGNLNVGNETSGAMTVTGAGSTLAVGNLNVLINGAGPGLVGALTLSDGAVATQSGTSLDVGQSAFNNSATLNVQTGATLNSSAANFGVQSNGALNVVTGGAVNASGNVAVNSGGGTGGAGAAINVNGVGSVFIQSGATTIIVGDTETGVGSINIGVAATAGTLTTGTGLFTIDGTGTVKVGAGSNRGTLNANGDVTINGGALTRGLGSTFNLAAGKTMTTQNAGSASFTGSYTTATNAIYNVTGGGSLFETTGMLTVGGGAQLNIGATTSGGTVVSAGMRVLATSVVTVGSANSIGTLDVGGQTLDLIGGLLVNNGTVSGDTNVNVGSLATGAGSYDAVNVFKGGTLSPGNSTGAATLTGASFNSGGSYRFELADAAGAPGSGYDFLDISGQLNITAGSTPNSQFTIELVSLDAAGLPGLADNFDPSQAHNFVLATAAAGITGFSADKFNLDLSAFENDATGGQFSVVQSGNDLLLAFSPGFLAADFDEDTDVDSQDLAEWITGFGTSAGASHLQGDADSDQDVDGTDFLVWQRQFGSTSAAIGNSQHVPEPTGLALISLAALALGRLRLRRASLV